IGMLYKPLTLEVGALTPEGKALYLEPATIDMLYTNIGNFYEKNPHEEITTTTGSGLSEGPGNTFTCVYWMGRAYGIIPAP
ncbi:MAG: hypothetical protein HWN65_23865, partial [Candidatus Helarchaeota archaeon]|nr:hypothetical protein [Candidatus Helarchaeota archaeon]